MWERLKNNEDFQKFLHEVGRMLSDETTTIRTATEVHAIYRSQGRAEAYERVVGLMDEVISIGRTDRTTEQSARGEKR